METRKIAHLAPDWLPVWIGFALVALLPLRGLPVFFTHNLGDPDDFARLTQVMAWLDGQSWYDLTLRRVNPPHGVDMYFSRLVDLPIAAFTLLLEPMLGRIQAIYATANFLPIIYFGVFLAAVTRLAHPLAGRTGRMLATVIVVFMPHVTYEFTQGRLDHHGVQLILVALSLVWVQNIIVNVRPKASACMLGLTVSLSMAIGAESMPWLVLLLAFLGVFFLHAGERQTIPALYLGISLVLNGWIMLALTRPVAQWDMAQTLSYSLIHACFLTATGAAFLATSWANHKFVSLRRRAAVSGGLAMLLVVAFFTAFPAMRHGPMGDASQDDMRELIAMAADATPLFRMPYSLILAFVLIPQLTFFVAVIRFMNGSSRQKWLGGLYVLLIGASMALALFYMGRTIRFTELFLSVPLAWFLTEGLRQARRRFSPSKAAYIQAGILFILTPALLVGVPALIRQNSSLAAPLRCDVNAMTDILNTAPWPNRPRNVFSSLFLGPEIMAKTPHAIFAAPYFGVTSNKDVREFFFATDLEKARAIAGRYHVDLVAQCRDFLTANLWTEPAQIYGPPLPTLSDLMLAGRAPHWLVALPTAGHRDFVIYKVIP